MNGIQTSRSHSYQVGRVMSSDPGESSPLMDIPTAISLVAMIGAFMRR